MSWRQPARTANPATPSSSDAIRICAFRLIRHLRDLFRMEALQQLAGIRDAEARVLRLNAEEEPVAAGADKIGRIEYRMIGLRQSIERKHPKDSSQRCAEHGALKRHRDKCGPGVERFTASIDWIGNRGNPVFQRVTANHPEQCANEDN